MTLVTVVPTTDAPRAEKEAILLYSRLGLLLNASPSGNPRSPSLGVARCLEIIGEPMTADEICMLVFGKCGSRERNVVAVTLHRLDRKGQLRKFPMRYTLVD